MRRWFRRAVTEDPVAVELDRAGLDRDGWTKLRMFGESEVAGLAAVFAAMAIDPEQEWFSDNLFSDADTRRRSARHIEDFVQPALARLAPDLVASGGNFNQKTDMVISLHQDWTMVDESSGLSSYMVWIPLVATDEANGAIRLISGSHRWERGIRGSGAIPMLVERVSEPAWGSTELVTTAVGEVLIWNSRLVHGSGPNTTGRPRPAAVSAIVPKGAQLVHFHRTDAGELLGFEVDADFFPAREFSERPEGFPPVEPWTNCTEPFDAAALAAALAG